MSTRLSTPQGHFVRGAGIIILAAALIVTTISCTDETGPGPTPAVRYDLTVTSTDGGSVTSPGEGTFSYAAGKVVNLVATPASNYRFVNWTGDVAEVANADAASTTITMNADYSVAANFATIGSVQYSLTAASTTGGSVTTPGEGSFTYDADTLVNLVATPATGYRFVNWTGDGVADPGSATTTIKMDAVRSVTANFAVLRYSLTLVSTAGGSVTTPGEGNFTHDYHAVVDLVATADAGHTFVAWTGDVTSVHDVYSAQTTITMKDSCSLTASFERTADPMVAGGAYHTLGLNSDGSVVATGDNQYGQCNVEEWTDIVQVDGGGEHSVGLKSDGTVVAVGFNGNGQCEVDGWGDIVQVAAGRRHTLGLRSNGTAVATGYNEYGQCDVDGWTDIVQIAAGANSWHSVGLKSDGTVVAKGNNASGQCEVDSLTGIVQIAAGGHHTVGLRSDGTVVAVGRNTYGECDLDRWTDIIQIAAGCQLTVGLKSDGTLVTAGWTAAGQRRVGDWAEVVQIAAGMVHTLGLRSDGGVLAAGASNDGQCDVAGWILT